MNETELSSGVYLIRCVHNNKVYVGSTVNLAKRIDSHRKELDRGKHRNKYLQRAWIKHGRWGFQFVIHERCEVDKLLEREQFWITVLKTCDPAYGYNMCPVAGTMLGFKHTEETKNLISQMQKGKILTEEHKKKVSESNKGRVVTECTRAKIGAANAIALKGKPGHKHTEESKRLISIGHKGKKLSEEHREKLRLAKLGRSWSKKRRSAQEKNIWTDGEIPWVDRAIHLNGAAKKK